LYVFFIPAMPATSPAHLILFHFITLIIGIWWSVQVGSSSLWSLLHLLPLRYFSPKYITPLILKS
jgi:hypothetical protein